MPEELKERLSPCPCAATEPGKQKNKIYLREKNKAGKEEKEGVEQLINKTSGKGNLGHEGLEKCWGVEDGR